MEFRHKSVLLEESIEALHIRPDGIYVDGTLGGGGHSYEICRRLSDRGQTDRDRSGCGGDCSGYEAFGRVQRPGDYRAQQLL